MAVTDLISFAVIGFVALRLVSGLRVSRSGAGRALVHAIVSNIGWRHVWPVPFVLAAVVGTATLLMLVPGLDWGWWSALGGDGNPVFGATDSTVGTVAEWLVPLVMMALLLPALPLFAHAEERMFRTGAEGWSTGRRVWRTFQFGMVHALIGIPIGAALALSIGGAHFLRIYLRTFDRTGSPSQATIESATAHTVYNGCIVGVVVIAFATIALVPGAA